MVLLTAVVILLCAYANYLLHRDIRYPGFLQAALWGVAALLFLATQSAFAAVSDGTFLLLISGVVLFSMGAFVGSYDHQPEDHRTYLLPGTLPTRGAVLGLTLIVLVGLGLYLLRAAQLAGSGPTANPFINLRYAVSVSEAETGGFGYTAYFIPMAYLLAGIVFLMRFGLAVPLVSRRLVALAAVTGFTFGILWAARSVLLPLMVVAVGIPLALRAIRPAKAGLALTGAMLLLFAAVGIAVGKGGSVGSTIGENWSTMREAFVTYAVGGIPALDTFLTNRGPDVDFGLNTFRSLVAVFHTLGFSTTAPPLVQPWVDVPMPTNVYTVYQPYIKDFGLGGVAVMFPLGFAHAVLYRRATVKTPHAIAVFLFALSLFPLVMQPFQDMYFSLLSLWIQYGSYALLLFVIFNERRRPLRGARAGRMASILEPG